MTSLLLADEIHQTMVTAPKGVWGWKSPSWVQGQSKGYEEVP